MESQQPGPKPSRRFGHSIARVAVTAAIALIALETTARLFVFGWVGLDLRRVPLISVRDPSEFVNFETEPSILFELLPGVDRLLTQVRFRTNSWGMRDREYPMEKPDGSFRVAVIGSSYSVPAGVEIDEAYHSVLERRLTEKSASRSYEFLNFAVGRHMPSQFIAMLKHRALRFDPDLVIVSLTKLSLPLFLRDWNRKPNRLSSEPHVVLKSYLVRLAMERTGLGRKPGKVPRIPRKSASVPDVIDKFAEFSRETTIPIVFFRITVDPVDPWPIELAIERRVWDAGMYYVDSRERFEGVNPRDFWIHKLDPHPDARANELFAQVLTEFLQSRGLLGN